MQETGKTNSSLGRQSGSWLLRQRVYCLYMAMSLALCLAACAGQETQPELNSERIRQTFGSYGVDVLFNDANRRVSSLYSGDSNDRTTRSYAVVDFADPATPALVTEHALVESGQSIG